MKTLTVKQPFATLICAGLKTVENRSRPTSHRGPLLIHAGGTVVNIDIYDDSQALPVHYEFARLAGDLSADGFNSQRRQYLEILPETGELNLMDHARSDPQRVAEYYMMLRAESSEDSGQSLYPAFSIVGTVDVTGCKQGLITPWSDGSGWQWILENPVLFDKPTPNIKGQLPIWSYDGILESDQPYIFGGENA